MLITLLNDGTLISIGYDHVKPSKYPDVWNLPVVFSVASVLSGVALVSSLIILYLCLDSWRPGSLFQEWGLGGLSYGQITTVIYLKVSISDFLTLFSARTHDGFFWSSAPSKILVFAALFALSLSTALACEWPASYPDGMYALGLSRRNPKVLSLYVWLYCLFWWLIQDGCKVLLYFFLHKYNIFGINNTMMIEKERELPSDVLVRVASETIMRTLSSQGTGHHHEKDSSLYQKAVQENPIHTNSKKKTMFSVNGKKSKDLESGLLADDYLI